MIRILQFLVWVIFFAFVITALASLDSRITGEAFGYKFDGPSGLMLGLVFLALLSAIYLTHKIKDIIALPGKMKAREEAARRARGVAALTRGLEAVAVGDAADAAHHARVARRHLDEIALTRLLSAQAAQLSGDKQAAEESFTAMLGAPETEFLGLKGLYLQAIAKDDPVAARGYAERAFRLRSNAGWAFESVVELSLDRGAWGDARAAITSGRRNHLIAADKADRALAALYAADAYAAAASDDEAAALKETHAALKLAPGFTPAAVLGARLELEAGHTGRAAKALEAAFALAAHPALVRLYDDLYKDDTVEKRAARLRKLATKNADAPEAKLAEAMAHNLLEEWTAAIEKLELLIEVAPTAFECRLMAEAVAGLNGEEAGRRWLEQAAGAPRDPRPGADADFHFTRAGWAQLVREYMNFARLAPPPLEDTVGLSSEEIRLLTAPPAPDVPPAGETDAAAEAPEAAAGDEEGEAPESAIVVTTEDASPPADETPAAEAQEPSESPSPPQEQGEGAAPQADEDGEHIHDDEEAQRIARAAREVS